MAIRSNDHDLWKISIRDIPKDKLLSQRSVEHRSEIRDTQSDFHRTKLFGSLSQLIGFTKKCSVENNAMATWAIFFLIAFELQYSHRKPTSQWHRMKWKLTKNVFEIIEIYRQSSFGTSKRCLCGKRIWQTKEMETKQQKKNLQLFSMNGIKLGISSFVKPLRGSLATESLKKRK